MIRLGDGAVHLLQQALDIALDAVRRATQGTNRGSIEIVLQIQHLITKLTLQRKEEHFS